MPWVCIGDSNDLSAANEKRGQYEHPNWKLRGFNRAINDCGLLDLGMEGYKFTWERSQGTDNCIEERRDRAFATDSWFRQFHRARVCSLEASGSDNLPILLEPNPKVYVYRYSRFRFENLWLREARCVEVICSSWVSSIEYFIQRKIKDCGSALLVWGGQLARDFHKRTLDCKQQMASLRGRRDADGVIAFTEARNRYNELLHCHEVF